MKISAIILSKNEEAKITDCLESLKFADEIILIDNGSSDNTCNIAKKFNAKIYRYNFNDFSHLRNKGKEHSSGDWLLYLDADERITPDLEKKIREAVKDENFNAYKINRVNYYYNLKWPDTEKMVRLIRKKSLIKWYGEIHESPIISGNTGMLGSNINHFTHDNLHHMVGKTNNWSDTEAKLRYQECHPEITWWRFFRVMITAWWNSYIRTGGAKMGIYGIIESMYQSYSIFITYAKLWELQNP